MERTPAEGVEGLADLQELRDILHAEKQLVKALPKMAGAARHEQLRASSSSICKKLKIKSSASMKASRSSAATQGLRHARA
jgi:hypothetical protein